VKQIHWLEHISATTRIIIFALSSVGALATSTSAQTRHPEGSTRGFSLGGHFAVIGVNPDSFGLNGQAANPRRATMAGGG
jgi:hypothetical protein